MVKTLGFHDETGRDNNFNLLRLASALLILFFHCYPLTLGEKSLDPISKTLHFHMGTAGVYTFMVISGFLAAKSFLDRKRVIRFLEARFLRIYPGLIVCILFCVFVIGPSFSSLPFPEYLTHAQTSDFLVYNVSLRKVVYLLPGVFHDNPYPLAVNGSLWILPYLLRLYLVIAVLGVFSLLTRRILFNALFILFCAACFLVPGSTIFPNPYWPLWSFAFLSGTFLFVNRKFIPLDLRIMATLWCLPIATAIFSSAETALYQVLFQVALTYSIVYSAFVPSGRIRFFNRFGDYSYGIYIYAFPIQQSLAQLFSGIGPLKMFPIAAVTSFLVAFLSWHAIEKPALARKGTIVGTLDKVMNRLPPLRRRLPITDKHAR